MLVLFETSAGYAIFKLHDEKKLLQAENLFKDFADPTKAAKLIHLQHFQKFKDTADALESATATVEGKMSHQLKKLLKKVAGSDMQEQLAVADAKLGGVIREKFDIDCIHNTSVQELMRCIRSQTDSLVSGLAQKEIAAMQLGLAHSLSRYKLKFSPDKVDTMIVQAISLLDDLDKELNNYMMRTKEWYGWHFPELAKLIQDNLAYVRLVKEVGIRTNFASADLSKIIPEEMISEVKQMAEISMGTEISQEDIMNIQYLCEQIIEITEYRSQLNEYLANRMQAIAPNLTVLVGEIVGARLIAHAGSLINLAKHPASTVQILGSEKALFRALKERSNTPKYGLIYHAALVSSTNPKNKGKISRMLAAKASLAIRVDALGEDGNVVIGLQNRAKLERRLQVLEAGKSSLISTQTKIQWGKYENKSNVLTYESSYDDTTETKKRKRTDDDDATETQKRKRTDDDNTMETQKRKRTDDDSKPKKKKIKAETIEAETIKAEIMELVTTSTADETDKVEKKKKKKKKQKPKSDEGVDLESKKFPGEKKKSEKGTGKTEKVLKKKKKKKDSAS